MSDSELIRKEPCPACGSQDNLARYSDGHAHCFGMGCGYRERGDGSAEGTPRKPLSKDLIALGEPAALSKRRITEATCAKWGYTKSTLKGKTVQVANYRDEKGGVVAQKVRFADKSFVFLGDTKNAGLYGQHLWRDGGKMVVVTEGELDALSVSQVQDNKWPVVSVPNGAQGAKKAVAKALEWLLKFDHVVFMLDNDEHGRAAAIECAAVLPPGRAKIASLPLKDASEMLQEGRAKEIIDAIWGAKEYRPDGIVTMADLEAAVMQPIEVGLPWAWETLTGYTYGRRMGEVVAIGAGTGIGKTAKLTQQIRFDVCELGEKVGAFFLEQQPVETARRVLGMEAKKLFHIPDAGWEEKDLKKAWKVFPHDKLFLYDHFGTASWDDIRDRIRYLNKAHGVRLFYLDHLTALAAGAEDERKELERIMAEIGGLVKELNVWLCIVSHLATPDGAPHEEGGRVAIRHFKGSRAIGFWCHFMIGLERDQQDENEAMRSITAVRMLKDRYTGRSTGQVFYLGYERDTGWLFETTPEFGEEKPASKSADDDDTPF